MYVEDDILQRVHDAADQALKDAMDLAYLTGQRPTDMRELATSRTVRWCCARARPRHRCALQSPAN